MGSNGGTKNSVEKALIILASFSPHNRPVGSSELGRMLGFTIPTVNRLLHILESQDFVKQDPATRKFSLGKAAFDVGTAVSRTISTEVAYVARPFCDKLRDEIGETVGFEIWSGDSTIQAYNAPSLSPISVLNTLGRIGEKYPVHVAAGAKAILAYAPPELVDQVLSGQLKPFTPNTITDPAEFKKHLQEVREKGYSTDNGEFHIEVFGIAAPVFNAFKKAVAAVVIAAPFYRAQFLLESNAITKLSQAASDISAQLLYSKDEENGQ